MSLIKLEGKPAIEYSASVVGKREHEGPLGKYFDIFDDTDAFGKDSWEKAESEMQRVALDSALAKGELSPSKLGAIFAGDLLNQCTGSAYGLAGFDTPYFGLYGACSTAAEALMLSSLMVDSGKMHYAAAVSSSHNCSAERQYRFPLEYGAQRPPTAQWTVTGAAAFVVGEKRGFLPRIVEVLPGRTLDAGITDANNMGAAMAPAAADTIRRYFDESNMNPVDFDAIVTGDLGYEGSGILVELLDAEGIDISKRHLDCGLEIYDREKQDSHAGGSGCGCSAIVLASVLLERLKTLEYRRILFAGTGAMMSPTSLLQGLAIPGIAHLLRIDMSE